LIGGFRFKLQDLLDQAVGQVDAGCRDGGAKRTKRVRPAIISHSSSSNDSIP
jgi:hypothetical protein